jgi:hypothetical protein
MKSVRLEIKQAGTTNFQAEDRVAIWVFTSRLPIIAIGPKYTNPIPNAAKIPENTTASSPSNYNSWNILLETYRIAISG